MLTSGAILYISLFCDHQSHTDIFMFFSCTMHYTSQRFFFTLYDPCFPYFLIDHNQKQVLLIKRVIIFLYLKNIIFFRSFQLFENHFRKVASKLINVMKLEVENINMLI